MTRITNDEVEKFRLNYSRYIEIVTYLFQETVGIQLVSAFICRNKLHHNQIELGINSLSMKFKRMNEVIILVMREAKKTCRHSVVQASHVVSRETHNFRIWF